MIIDQILRKRLKFVPVFRKYLAVSSWNLAGYFSVSFRFPQVTDFGKSTAIYISLLRKYRKCTWKIRFLAPGNYFPAGQSAFCRSWPQLKLGEEIESSRFVKNESRKNQQISKPTLRQGWVLSKRTCVFNGIQFTRYFIEFVVVETKQIVSSNSNVILMRQTCGQRSGLAAGCKRQALEFDFSVRICYMFPMSKCRRESDLGLCTISALAKRILLHSDILFFDL